MRLGVIGTMVWDTIHAREAGAEVVEEWGGISYALAALAAALPDSWSVVPILKVGRDLSESALRFLRSLPRLEVDPGVRVVPEPNNRVELRYRDRRRRCERLIGGVPPWEWSELRPLLHGLDALYVNFISGFEMTLETALALRAGFPGPIYADLHSLFLGIAASGERVPRRLPDWGRWIRSFDVLQLNEDEFRLLGVGSGDPWRLAAEAVGPDLKLIVVTLGPRGAAYVASWDFVPGPLRWPELRRPVAGGGPARSGLVAQEEEVVGDPTGCGDVWGGSFFARLLAGDGLEEAMAEANRMAARNVRYRGASGLHHFLRGRLATETEVT